MLKNLFTLSGILIFISSIAFGFFVYLHDRKKKLYQLWLFFCLCVSLWGFGCLSVGLSKDAEMALFFWKFCYFGIIFIPSLFYHFISTFIFLKRPIILAAVYIISAIFAIANCMGFMVLGVVPMFGGLYYLYPAGFVLPLFVCFFILVMISCYCELWLYARKNSAAELQIKWFSFATLIGFTGGLTAYLPTFDIHLFPYANYTVVLYPIIMSYAIMKHRLMDIKTVIRKTFIYSLTVLSISFGYVVIIFIVHKLMFGQATLSPTTRYIFENLFVSTSFVCVFLCSGLVIFSYFFAKSKTYKLFSAFNLAVVVWSFGCLFAGMSREENTAMLGWRIAIFGGFFTSTVFYHIIWTLCRVRDRRMLKFSYAQALFFTTILIFYPSSMTGNPRLAFGIIFPSKNLFLGSAVAAYFVIVGASFVQLIRHFYESKGHDKKQTSYLLFGFGLGFFSGTLIILPWFKIDFFYPSGNAGVALYALIMAYAILRHELLDIKIVIKRTIYYSIATISISFVYLAGVYLLHSFFIAENLQASFYANFISILFIAITFKPLEMTIHRYAERRFFKGTIVEIAEQKALLETELERRERLKSVGILAAGMAHEIKNPITAIRTFAEYLPKKYEDPIFRQKFSSLLVQETDRISGIVKDLLLFAKPGEPVIAPFDMGRVLKNLTELLRGDLLKHSIDLRLEIGADLPMCLADSQQIRQALMNVIMNAIDAMKVKNGQRLLTITATKKNDEIEVVIEDTGIGIPPDKLPHLFDPFYTAKEGGTGLGLAITHSIMEKNGKVVRVQSVVGEGSAFAFLLICAPQC